MREGFDPTSWRESHRRQLEELHAKGKVDLKTYREALAEVDRIYREMVGEPPSSGPSRPRA